MAEIFKSAMMKKGFEQLYQVLIPNLNVCDNCGILKCFYCNKFIASCSLCSAERCKNCVKYNNAVDFFYNQCSAEQWNYICNFLYDLFHISWIRRWYFKDISRPINSSVTKTSFLIASSNPLKNSVKKIKRKLYIIY